MSVPLLVPSRNTLAFLLATKAPLELLSETLLAWISKARNVGSKMFLQAWNQRMGIKDDPSRALNERNGFTCTRQRYSRSRNGQMVKAATRPLV